LKKFNSNQVQGVTLKLLVLNAPGHEQNCPSKIDNLNTQHVDFVTQ
jgi:hypothetical protein